MGNLYFINTVGAVLGAAVASFVLSRRLGTMGGFLALTALFVVAAVLLVTVHASRGSTRAIAVLLLAVAVLAGTRMPADLVQLRHDEELVASGEDEYGVQVLARTDRGTLRVRNNRLSLIYDLGEWETSHAQQMPAHLAVLLADGCSDVLNVGTGYGITAGAFTLYDDVGTIDTVEILPFLVERQNQFSEFNFDYVKDPRVNLVRGDGRHFLVTSEKSYDIISVNVLDPYLPGSSSLFTVDFWRIAREHLRPGGVYTALFWGADVDLLSRGLSEVFPTVLYSPAYGESSYNVIAFRDELADDEIRLRLDRLSLKAMIEIKSLTGEDPPALLQHELDAALAARQGFADGPKAAPGPLHTDDFPILEYRWAHGVKWVSILDSPLVAVE